MNNRDRRQLIAKIHTFTKKMCESENVLIEMIGGESAIKVLDRIVTDCELLSSLIATEIRDDWDEKKTCRRCDQTKPALMFYRKSRGNETRSSYCKECSKKVVNEHRKNVRRA